MLRHKWLLVALLFSIVVVITCPQRVLAIDLDGVKISQANEGDSLEQPTHCRSYLSQRQA